MVKYSKFLQFLEDKGCSRKFFGMSEAPELPYSLDELDTLAAQIIQSQTQFYKTLPKKNEDLRHRAKGLCIGLIQLTLKFGLP